VAETPAAATPAAVDAPAAFPIRRRLLRDRQAQPTRSRRPQIRWLPRLLLRRRGSLECPVRGVPETMRMRRRRSRGEDSSYPGDDRPGKAAGVPVATAFFARSCSPMPDACYRVVLLFLPESPRAKGAERRCVLPGGSVARYRRLLEPDLLAASGDSRACSALVCSSKPGLPSRATCDPCMPRRPAGRTG